MHRGKAQILYRYLPFSVFNFDHDYGIFRVKDFNTKAIDKSTYDVDYIFRRIVKYIDNWDIENRDFPDKLNPTNFYFGNPTSVEAELFPLVFECANCGCIHYFNSIPKGKSSIRCKNCKGKLRQIPFIAIHKCGKVSQLFVRKCAEHGYEYIILMQKGQRMSNYTWYCKVSGCKSNPTGLYMNCNCNYEGSKNMDIVNINSSEAYYPQGITLLNLRDVSEEKDRVDKEIYSKVIIAQYLGLFDSDMQHFRSLLKEEENTDKDIEQMRIMMQSLGLSEEEIEGQLQSIITMSKEKKTRNKDLEEILNRYDQLFNEDSNKLLNSYEEIYEFVKLDDDSKIKVHELKNIETQNEINKLGISKLRLIENLPVTNAVFGYTRVEREPGSAKLKSFPVSVNTENKFPVYVDTTESEALQFQLDHRKVLEWLNINNIIDINVDKMNDAEIKAWFIKHLKRVDYVGKVEEEDIITRYVYGLLHSLSHLFLKQCSLISGFDKNSLSEYIMLKALSFIIYSNNRQSFNIGGLFTTFEQRILELLDRVKHFGNLCVYDPVCKTKEGSCHSCMHIAEFSCVGFNRNLSRNFLFGGKVVGEKIIGYLDI